MEPHVLVDQLASLDQDPVPHKSGADPQDRNTGLRGKITDRILLEGRKKQLTGLYWREET
jgi:hypothetical protein